MKFSAGNGDYSWLKVGKKRVGDKSKFIEKGPESNYSFFRRYSLVATAFIHGQKQ